MSYVKYQSSPANPFVVESKFCMVCGQDRILILLSLYTLTLSSSLCYSCCYCFILIPPDSTHPLFFLPQTVSSPTQVTTLIAQ